MNDTTTITVDAEADLEDMLTPPRQEQQVATVQRAGELAAEPPGEFRISVDTLAAMASNTAMDADKLERLIALQERMEKSQAEREFNRAMALAQGEMQPVVRMTEVKLEKDGVSKGSYKYASLDNIDEMLRPIMTKYGFSVTYDRRPRQGDGGGLEVIGTLRHRDGHSITATFPLALDSGPGRSNAQAAGSTDSYGRKYILLGFFNIIRKNEDDDGATAGVMPLSTDAEGRKKAERLKQLVDEAGITEGAETALDRKAAILGWFHSRLDYEVANYLDVRNEDYARLVRLLRIEKQAKDARDRKEADI